MPKILLDYLIASDIKFNASVAQGNDQFAGYQTVKNICNCQKSKYSDYAHTVTSITKGMFTVEMHLTPYCHKFEKPWGAKVTSKKNKSGRKIGLEYNVDNSEFLGDPGKGGTVKIFCVCPGEVVIFDRCDRELFFHENKKFYKIEEDGTLTNIKISKLFDFI
jgi:hypothetical protein